MTESEIVSQNDSEMVSQVMSRTPLFLSPKDPVKTALKIMSSHDIGCILIMEDGNLVGIVTERDIVRKIGRNNTYSLGTPLGRLDSKPVITIPPQTPVWEAFTIMLKKKIRRLPVIDQGKLVGIVTERDLFKWVVKVAYEPNIPDEIKALIAQCK